MYTTRKFPTLRKTNHHDSHDAPHAPADHHPPNAHPDGDPVTTLDIDSAVRELVSKTPLTTAEATDFVQKCIDRDTPTGPVSVEVVRARLEYVVAGELHQVTTGRRDGARSVSRRRFTAAGNRLWALLHPAPEAEVTP